jgi:hypothetical protein
VACVSRPVEDVVMSDLDLALPPVAYHQTAHRPSWADLPAELCAAIADRLGSPVIHAAASGAGFTQGFASLVTTADGRRHFLKAASRQTEISRWYEREAQLTALLPAGVPTAALRWTAEPADHFVLCLAPIDSARVPALPWQAADLDAALHAQAQAASALAEPSDELLAAGLEPFGQVLDSALSGWRKVAGGERPIPGGAPAWLPDRLPHLSALETRFDESTRDVATLLHCDLRLDNIVLDGAGRAWICDWNFLGFGPPWMDTMTLLLSAVGGDLPVDELFGAHPTAAGLAPDALDSGLAAICGYYLYAAGQPPVPGSPAIRDHQGYYGRLALRWLSRRQGWNAA